MEIARRRLIEPPPVAKGVPARFAAALAKGMARQPDNRPGTATALLEMLSGSLDELSQPVAFRETVRAAIITDDPPRRASVLAVLPDALTLAPAAVPAAATPALESPPPSSSEPAASAPLLSALPAVLVAAASPRPHRDLDPRMPALLLILVAAVTGTMLTVLWLAYLGEAVRGLFVQLLWT
jgi:hypothetical protein